jgi:phosphatidylglycerophosphate synthase
LAAAAGKGHMEWYVVAFNRPVEQWLSLHLAETRITPNQITFISNVTAYAATALLALGHLAAAFAFIVATGILDGLDGRQARIQIKTSKVGEWEHVFDALSELSWMVALGWFISAGFGEPLLAAATAAWIAFYAADNYSYTFFRLRRHMMIDEASPIDAAIRFVASRRNTSFAYFFIIAALGYPTQGFLAVVGFAGLTAAVHWIRVATLLSR